ncbi:MAG: glycosyltransferase [Alphaproteobacteria bacterium]|nr:glycosyltransferase [Alphaproteobacteria bacterium]
MKISVVICGYSNARRDELLASIASIQKQSHAAYEIIVVIDHNDDLLAFMIKSVAGIKAIPNAAEKGLSGARNSGIQAASGDVIAFIDDDAVADADWLMEVERTFAGPDVIGMGGRILPLWPDRAPRWFPEEFYWVIGCSYRGQPEEQAEIRNPIGCNMAFRRSAFDAAGLFQTGVGRLQNNAAGCEETELCIRIKQALPRGRILYTPLARVSHRVSPDRVSFAYFMRRCIAEGRSKARVVALTGAEAGLSSERSYVYRTLPHGVAREFLSGILRLDPWGPVRAITIVFGFLFTTYGFVRASWRGGQLQAAPAFRPYKICDIETTEPLAPVRLADHTGAVTYGGLYCLLRRKGRPAGLVEMTTDAAVVGAGELQALIDGACVAGEGDETSPAVPLDHPPAISVVIATRERAESLRRTLESLLVQDYSDFDIVVVDNAPVTPHTRELIDQRYRQTGRVSYVVEPVPGLGQAHNRGLAMAMGRIIAFTDDDVIVDKGWLKAIAAAFIRDPQAGCVTGLIMPAELETRAQYWTEKHGGFGKGFKSRTCDLGANRQPGPLYPYTAGQFGSGANMSFRAEVLRSVGGFDPALGAGTFARGGDDLAAFLAVIQSGHRIVYEPAAIVWHFHRRGEDGMRRQAFSYGVGLGAYLTKQIIERPSTMFTYLGVLPAGLVHILGRGSEKNRRLPADYPTGLRWRERLGILFGFPAYIVSRHRTSRQGQG